MALKLTWPYLTDLQSYIRNNGSVCTCINKMISAMCPPFPVLSFHILHRYFATLFCNLLTRVPLSLQVMIDPCS